LSEIPNHSEPEDASGIDPGEPVKELAGFEYDPSDVFWNVVRRKIQRRSTVSQVASFSWNIPKLILAEAWSALIHIIGSQSGKKEKGL
jgi:hypothetical protein